MGGARAISIDPLRTPTHGSEAGRFLSSAKTTYREPVPLAWSDGLDIAAVLAGQGIDPSSRGARLAAVQAAACRALSEGRPLLEPALASRIVPVADADLLHVALQGGCTIHSAACARALSGSLQVLAVACTIGEAIDRRAGELMREDPTAAMALDGLGTAAVNALAGAICANLGADAARAGQRTTRALSPGQGEWDLEEGQRLIFALVEPARIGVTLSESAQMRPCKSLSFLVGIGPTVNDRAGGGCGGCASRPGCHWSTLRKER